MGRRNSNRPSSTPTAVFTAASPNIPSLKETVTECLSTESALLGTTSHEAAETSDLDGVDRTPGINFCDLDKRLSGIERSLAEVAQAIVRMAPVPTLSGAEGTIPDTYSPELPRKDAILDPRSDSHQHAIVEAELRSEIETLRDEMECLQLQNEELAGQIAQVSVRRSIDRSSDSDATLTWEQRKALLFAQDEEIVVTDSGSTVELSQTVERLRTDIQTRDDEIAQLRELLEQRPAQCEEGTAFGAAAIAQLIDSDELVQEERQRLQDLQVEWEGKFRKMEIAASIERANLARERQQLEKQNIALEEQIAHMRRELRQEELTGPNQTRRWLAKLGLAD